MRLIGLNPCSHPPLLIHWRLRCLQKEKDIMGCTLVERVRKFLRGELPHSRIFLSYSNHPLPV